MGDDECTSGKIPYAAVGSAGRAAKIARRRSNDVILPYRCAECHAWHIGHTTRTVEQQRLIEMRRTRRIAS